MAGRFSFAEEEQEAIVALYCETVEKMDKLTDKFVENLTELCAKTQYKPFVELSNRCIEFNNEDLREQVLERFQDWQDSGTSLADFVSKMNGGDDARETAQQLETRLQEDFTQLFTHKELLTADTSTPVVEPADYDQLVQYSNEYRESLEVLKADALKTIETRAEDNGAYTCISGVVASTTSGALIASEKLRIEIEAMKEQFDERTREHVGAAESVTRELSERAEQAAFDRFGEALRAFTDSL